MHADSEWHNFCAIFILKSLRSRDSLEEAEVAPAASRLTKEKRRTAELPSSKTIFLVFFSDIRTFSSLRIKNKCDRKVNRFSSSIKIARISSSTRLDIHSSFSLSLSPSLEISSLFNFRFVFFLFDFFVLRFD